MKTIKILVFRFESGNMKVLYRNTVEVPDSLDFPFAKVESIMRLLYKYAEGVSFEVF